MKLRYAVFCEPSRHSEKWSVIGQARTFWIWNAIGYIYRFDTEEAALQYWRKQVMAEEDKRLGNGMRTSEWKP